MKKRESKTLALAAALDPSTSPRNLVPFDARLIELAMNEGVAGILYKSLLASGALDSLAQVQRETLEGFYYQTIRRNMRLMHALKQVLSHANQKGLAVVLLQGMGLMNDPYEDIGLRPMTDIDLWVSSKTFEPLVPILEALGYERDAVYPSTFKKGSTLFDIHTHFLWADRIQARDMILDRSEECFMGEVREIEIEGEKALCLSPSDRVLYLSLHAVKHRVNRLIWLVDIKRILERWNPADWRSLLRRAENLGQKKTLLYIFFLLKRIFRFRIPSEVLRLLEGKRLRPLEKKILRERVKKKSLPVWGPVLLFSSELGPVKRGLFLFENLYPRTEILRQVFPLPADIKPWQLYGKRTLELLGMLKRSLTGF